MAMRDEILAQIQCAELAGSYEQMIKYLKELIKLDPKLNPEALQWLSTAYERVVGNRRYVWLEMNNENPKPRSSSKFHKFHVDSNPNKVENEIRHYCREIINMVTEKLLPIAETLDEKILFYKLLGEYNHYLTEIENGTACREARDAAIIGYSTAYELSNGYFASCNPIRLSLILNFSTFRYNILNHYDLAYQMAEQAYSIATDELNNLDEEDKPIPMQIIQSIRQNLSTWDRESKHRDSHRVRLNSY
ncbi:14-3-3 protein 3-like [Teleopsis dalmanni]|uniref:14-3-3 protein 3-like n=1 Tax=Teleopsis dalmanni TaxID=139649 RepID=UPI0018CF9622|nr:14-3-3 protein 3-like [Teleopsis dalmanni]